MTEQFLEKLAEKAYLRLHDVPLTYKKYRRKYRKLIAKKCDHLKTLVTCSDITCIEKIEEFENDLCGFIDGIGIKKIGNSHSEYNITGPKHQMQTIYYSLNERSLSSLKRTLRQILYSIERFQKKPDGDGNKKSLNKSERLAYQSYEYAVSQKSELADKTDKDAKSERERGFVDNTKPTIKKLLSKNFIKATIKHFPYFGSYLFDIIYGDN